MRGSSVYQQTLNLTIYGKTETQKIAGRELSAEE